VDLSVLGWPDDEPTLDLDHREFSYAGKFVIPSTGKAVAREDGRILGAVAFDPDRTDPDTLVIRYLTVREGARGEGIGPALVSFVVRRAGEEGYGRVAIHVNNPYSYQALYKAGFEFTGEESGLAELRLVRDLDETEPPDPGRYRAGLDRFGDRDLSTEQRAFLERKRAAGPPPVDPGRER